MSITTIQKKFVVSQDTEPTSPFNGQIWVRETDGQAFQYFNGKFKSIGRSEEEIEKISEKQAKKWGIIF